MNKNKKQDRIRNENKKQDGLFGSTFSDIYCHVKDGELTFLICSRVF